MLVKMWSNWNTHILLPGIQNGIASLEKLGNFFKINPLLERNKNYFHTERPVPECLFSIFIHNNKNSINQRLHQFRMDK